MLPWSVDSRETRRFRATLLAVAVVAVVMGVVVPLLDLPERSRQELESVPPQLAKVILEKKVAPVVLPKPVEPEPPKVEPRPEEPKPVEAKPQVKPVEPKKPIAMKPEPAPSEVEAAREVAKSSGLLALSDELADMRESMAASSFESKPLDAGQGGRSAQAERLVSDVSTRTSGGVDSSRLATVTERVSGGGQRETTRLQGSAVEQEVAAAAATPARASASRSIEEIRRIFDSNKAAIFAIYSRALRSNPALQGQILLELTIEPSGQVSAAKIVSSELGDKSLEQRIIARIKMFDFGSKKVQQQVVTWPLDFLPS